MRWRSGATASITYAAGRRTSSWTHPPFAGIQLRRRAAATSTRSSANLPWRRREANARSAIWVNRACAGIA